MREFFEVVARAAQGVLEREQALVEEVDVVLPRVADAREHLDGIRADAEERVAGERLRHRRGAVQLRGVLVIGGPQAVVRARAPELERREHVGAQVLHCLERTDRPIELRPFVAVCDGHVECGTGRAHAVDDITDHPTVDDAAQVACSDAPAAIVDRHRADLAGAVRSGHRRDVEVLDGVELVAVAHEDDISGAGVRHVVEIERERRHRRAVGDARDELVVGIHCPARRDRREERSGVHCSTHLLEHDAEIDHAHVRVEYAEGSETLPDLRCRADGIVVHGTHVRDRRAIGEETPQRVA